MNTFNSCKKLGERVSVVSKRNIKRKPWLTTAILKSINHKDNMYRKLKRKPHNISLENRYRTYKKKLESLIMISKQNYFHAKTKQAHGDSYAT